MIYSFLFFFFVQVWIQTRETISDRERDLPSVPWVDSETDFSENTFFLSLSLSLFLYTARSCDEIPCSAANPRRSPAREIRGKYCGGGRNKERHSTHWWNSLWLFARTQNRERMILDSLRLSPAHCVFSYSSYSLSFSLVTVPRLLTPDAQFWYDGQTTPAILIAREIEFRQLRVSRVKVNFATTLSLLLSPRPAESTSHRKTLRKRHNEGGGGEREATSDTRRQPPRPREKSRELTLLGWHQTLEI